MLGVTTSWTLRRRQRPLERPGRVSLIVLLAAGLLLTVLALAVENSHLWEGRVLLENASDSAALAGADGLVDDHLLTGQTSDLQVVLNHALTAAILFGEQNPVLGQPLQLDPNLDNAPDGDIVFGSVDSAQSKVLVPSDVNANVNGWILPPVNAVRITGRRTQARGNPAALYFGGLLGRASADLRVSATAMLDRDVIGFRTRNDQTLPLVPIALFSDPTQVNPISWDNLVVARNGPDQYRFHHHTKTFEFDPSGDGLHEMTVTLAQNGCLVLLGVTDESAAINQVGTGITPAQMQNLGGQLVLGADNTLAVPADAGCGPVAGTAGGDELVQLLQQLQQAGDLHLWPLFSGLDPSSGQAVLIGFVAARIANVGSPAAGQPLSFTLQPGMLATSTAITDASRRGVGGVAIVNPFVVKVRLVE